MTGPQCRHRRSYAKWPLVAVRTINLCTQGGNRFTKKHFARVNDVQAWLKHCSVLWHFENLNCEYMRATTVREEATTMVHNGDGASG